MNLIKSLQSPNYPEAYDKKSHCLWNIQSKNPEDKIVIHFTHFDTYVDTAGGSEGGDSKTCYKSDYVQIFEKNRPELNDPKYCGTSPPPIRVTEKIFRYLTTFRSCCRFNFQKI